MDEDITKKLRHQVGIIDLFELNEAMQDASGLRSQIINARNEQLNDLQMVCSCLGCTSKELVRLVMSGRVGYIVEHTRQEYVDCD